MNLCTNRTTKVFLPFTGEKTVAYGGQRRSYGRHLMKIPGEATIDE